MWNIPHKKLIFGLLFGLTFCGTEFGLDGSAFAQTRIAADNSIRVANSPPKTVKFMLSEPTEVFVRYDLGQSHGCCANHRVADLRILVDGIEFRRASIPFFNYGPISAFREDFDYPFPSQVVMGFEPPVSQLDPTRVGPLLQNYKRVDRQGLGNLGHLAAGSHTFELELGDAGWNSIFEIYSLHPQRPIAPDATAFGPLQVVSDEYQLGATVYPDVLSSVATELWARIDMPANLDHPPYPLLVFLHGNHATCGQDQGPGKPRLDKNNDYELTGTCSDPNFPIIIPNHAGYGYLAERLASWGYVVVSINANRGVPHADTEHPDYVSARARLVLKHLQFLSQWNIFGRSITSDFDTPLRGADLLVKLKGALDVTQVGLFGHSVGGEAVRAAYNFYQFGGDLPNVWPRIIPDKITFRGIFEIGPTDGAQRERTPNAPPPVFNPTRMKWNVLLPMCDGDNYTLEGVKPFDRMIAKGDLTQKSTFAVWGANHNFYNTEWQTNEKSTETTAGVTCVGSGNLRLFPETIGSPEQGFQQRQTALASVMAFFRGNVGREANPVFNQIFNPEFALPPVVSTVTRVDRGYTDGPASVFEDFGFPISGINTYGLFNDIEGIVMVHDINAIPDHNTRISSTPPTNRPAGLISWAAPGGFFQTNWAPPGTGRNIGQFQTLEFRISRQCAVSTHPNFLCPSQSPMNPTEPTNFSVRLAFGDGTLSEPVQLAAYSDVAGPIGVRRISLERTDRRHPILQTVRIPLADFREPLTRVRGIRFTFDSTRTGAIYMSDIRVSGTG